MKMFWDLFPLFIIFIAPIKHAANQQADAYCKIQNNGLICQNFNDFAQLNLSYFVPENISADGFESLKFSPTAPIFLDDSLLLTGIKVKNNYEIQFDSLSGFDILSNPLAFLDLSKKGIVTFSNSKLELFYENKTIDINTCSYILQNELIITLMYSSASFIVENSIYSANPICPILFDGSKLELFHLTNISPNNKFSIIESELLNLTNLPHEYSCTIGKFQIEGSDLTLDQSILSTLVFKNLYYLSIVNSFVRNIQQDLFKSFSFMKIVEFKLKNFEEFVQISENSNKWLSNLNIQISVDLNNITEVDNFLEFQMEFYLTDLNARYDFPEKDLCLFKDFPHQRLVAPKINTKPDLECTCSLLWLLKYKYVYQIATLNELSTPSTSNCLNKANFDELIENCNFKVKLEECDALTSMTVPATSTISILSSKSAPVNHSNGFKVATIALAVLTSLFLILSMCVFVYFKFFKRIVHEGQQIGLSELNN